MTDNIFSGIEVELEPLTILSHDDQLNQDFMTRIDKETNSKKNIDIDITWKYI